MDGIEIHFQKDKPGSKLAAKLTPKPRTLAFPKICTPSGDLTHNPIRIMELFHQFYSRLYKEDPPPPSAAIDSFLKDLPIPVISKSHRDLLDDPISTTEVLETIKSLKIGTSPGPDGFSVCYYKKCGPSLAPYMAQFFFNSLRDGIPIDKDLNTAYILAIPKPGKCTTEVSNYRPISLINNDLKIMTKILASSG